MFLQEGAPVSRDYHGAFGDLHAHSQIARAAYVLLVNCIFR